MRAPPKKLTWRQSTSARAFSSVRSRGRIDLAVLASVTVTLVGNLPTALSSAARHRLDVGELEQLERVEPALALEQLALLEQLARPNVSCRRTIRR